jgi:predicted phosphodiesterase
MRFTVVTDVHSETEHLRRVLVQATDPVVCLGDVFECQVSRSRLPNYQFASISDVFDQDEELAQLVDGAVLIRGNQEERICAVIPERLIPSWSKRILHADACYRTSTMTFTHGHLLPMQEVEPRRWCAVTAEFHGNLLVHGHHHRSAVYELPKSGRNWSDIVAIDPAWDKPIPLDPDRKYLINVGPVRAEPPQWAVVDEDAHTITYHRG